MGKLLYQQVRGRDMYTVFENHRKSLIQYSERSELRLHFKGQKFIKSPENGSFWRVFET